MISTLVGMRRTERRMVMRLNKEIILAVAPLIEVAVISIKEVVIAIVNRDVQ